MKCRGLCLNWLDHYKCATLTLFLIVFLILNPLLAGRGAWDDLLWSVFYLVVLFAPWFVSSNRRILLLSLVLGAGFLLPRLMLLFLPDPMSSLVGALRGSDAAMVMLILIESALVGMVCFYSLSTKTGGREPVWGCVLAFLLLAIVFSDVFWLISRNCPGAFSFNGAVFQPDMNELLYFSFSTLTTCGFGDIAPLHPLARQLAGLEGVAGVLYVALFIARVLADRRGRSERHE